MAVEGLHVALVRARLANVLRRISISGVEISYLLYADDVILVSFWDPENANRLIHILWCFYMVRGHKINLFKSKLIGVGTPFTHVSCVAYTIGCTTSDMPFFHLGVPIGHNMNHIPAWSPVLDHFQSRLLGWKAKCLSFGGRLMLVKLVLGSIGSYAMFIFLFSILILTSPEGLRARFFGAQIWTRCICIGLDGIKF